MKTYLTNADVILPDRIIHGYVSIENDRITGIGTNEPVTAEADEVIDLGGLYLAPGFIELHTHGAGGCDFMDGTADAFITAAMTHLSHGTTTLLPTALAATREEILRSIANLRQAKNTMVDGPNLLGLHIEGPYLNVKQKGAINEKYIRNPDPEEYNDFLINGKGAISRWTVAVELDGALDFGDRLKAEGILPSIGHTDAEYSQIVEAYLHGYTHVTHLYSAMSCMVRRGGFRFPGLTESAFCLEDMTVEIIADGCHLPIEILRMVYRLKGAQKICLSCDSMRCAGQEVKESILGNLTSGLRVIIEDDVAKLPDRSAFAGSIALDDRLVRVMYQKVGVPLYDAVRMMTLTPAEVIGISGKTGSIASGKAADLICFDDDIIIKGTMVGGHARSGVMKS